MHDSYDQVDIQNGVEYNDVMTKMIISAYETHKNTYLDHDEVEPCFLADLLFHPRLTDCN